MRDQVTGTTYSDGTPAVTMSYDAAGRPLEIGNAVATDAYAYDDAGQLAVETQSVAGHPAAMRTLTHSHDADGLRTGLVYPGGKVLAASYTARGQLATMTFHGQPVATSTYRPNGQPIGTVYGNGAQRTLSIPPHSPTPVRVLTVSGAAGAEANSCLQYGDWLSVEKTRSN